MSGIVTLTSDFGTGSPYVAQMKARVLAVNPRATLVDLCHAVPAQNILRGSLVLDESVWHFPPGTIHLAVVDPGVGTMRRLLGLHAAGHFFVGPDNGLFDGVLRRSEPQTVVSLTEPRFWDANVSATFHGRDIMAPVAGHLSLDVPLDQFGSPIELASLVRLDPPEPYRGRHVVQGHCLYADSFGNLVSNIRADQLPANPAPDLVIEILDKRLRLVRTYGDAVPGDFVALIGSHGRLEVALVGGSAAQHLPANAGTAITVRLPGSA